MEETNYLYHFDCYIIAEYLGLEVSLSKLCRVLMKNDNNIGIVMCFTEDQFKQFRCELALGGIVLQSISRVPYYKPELVS